LLGEARVLKQEIAFFKKEVSQERIDKLIAERRREKEKKRQVLETRWRECNEAFKKLQEEQKKVNN
jgi:hypothetical protein